MLNEAHAYCDGRADLKAVRQLNAVEQALNLRHVGGLGLVEQSVFEQGDGRLEQPTGPLFGAAVVQRSLRIRSAASASPSSTASPWASSCRRPSCSTASRVGSDSGRFLTMQCNAPGPVMQIFVLGSLLRCPVKNHGHGTALVNHQLLKSLFKGFLNVFILQRKLVIEVKDCNAGLSERSDQCSTARRWSTPSRSSSNMVRRTLRIKC